MRRCPIGSASRCARRTWCCTTTQAEGRRCYGHHTCVHPAPNAPSDQPALLPWATACNVWLRVVGRQHPRVHVLPLRIATARKFGSLLVAHVHNSRFAATRLNATHFLFLATNCWFVKPGVEPFVGSRRATLSARACPETTRPNNKRPELCASRPWWAALNRPHTTFSRQYVEGQFYPASMLAELDHALSSHDATGKRRPNIAPSAASAALAASASASTALPSASFAASPPSVLEALVSTKCTAEESLVPLLVLRSRQLRAVPPVTEPVVWVPPIMLTGGWNGTVSLREVKALIAATHSPQKLCAASATKKSGTAPRCACPSAEQWPATKFIVKRVSRASDDPGGVRAFLGAQVHKLTALHNSQPTP